MMIDGDGENNYQYSDNKDNQSCVMLSKGMCISFQICFSLLNCSPAVLLITDVFLTATE